MAKSGCVFWKCLKKALYSLKQALHVWYETLVNFFKKFNLNKTEANHDLFVSVDKTVFIGIHSDNWLLFRMDTDPYIDEFRENLWQRTRMTELGDVFYYPWMDIDIDFSGKTITLRQSI